MTRWRAILDRLRPSLLTRVLVALGVVGLVPMAWLSARLINVNREAMTDQVERTLVMVTRSVADGLGSFLETQISRAQGLASHPDLADPRSPAARELLRQNLQAWADLGILAVAVVNPAGEQVILAQLADEVTRQRVGRVFERPSDTDVATYPDPSGPVVRTRAPLPGDAGWLWLVSDASSLERALDAFELADEMELALLGSGEEAILGSIEGYPPEFIERARLRKILELDRTFLAGDETGQEREFVGASALVPHGDWVVVARQPFARAHAVAARMRGSALWAVGLTALLVALLSVGAWASVIRPIRQLAQAQRRLAGFGGGAGRGDEIGQLKASFDALERGLKEREALDDVFLGRYQVLEVLGSGAMGTVFLGRDPKLQRKVALKTIRLGKDLARGKRDDLLSRLVQEALTTARFSHPNIVAIYDIEDRAEAAFVAMEYIDGVSLEALLWRVGRLSPEQTIPLGAAIASGLAAAHAAGFVHRDVKPANILLGRDHSIKLTDFGISELLSSISDRPDVIFGTPGYLPPETLQGKGYHRSGDLFSLGSILYYALTGSRPFEGRTVKDVIRRTMFGSVKRPVTIEPATPAELDELVMRMLDADPAKRPSEASEVARALERMAAARDLRWELPEEAAQVETEVTAEADAGLFLRTAGDGVSTVVLPPTGRL